VKISLNKVILLAMLAIWVCGCHTIAPKCEPYRYAHSADFTEQVVMLSEKVGLMKWIKPDSGELNFALVETHRLGGEPELSSASGYQIDKWLVPTIRSISAVDSGAKLLVDMGLSPYRPQYALVDLTTAKTATGETLRELGTMSPSGWMPIELFFDSKLHERDSQ
jgi:hypothetical protein